jgi:hypothetical protein
MHIGEQDSIYDGHRIRKIDILVKLISDKMCGPFWGNNVSNLNMCVSYTHVVVVALENIIH